MILEIDYLQGIGVRVKNIKKVDITLSTVFPISGMKVRLTNEWGADTIFCSIFPEQFTQKPENNGYVMESIARFPNILTLDQLKEEVIKGRTFIGALFFDIDFYKQLYGGVTSLGIFMQSNQRAYLMWARRVYRDFMAEISQDILKENNYLINNVKMTQDYFVMLSTFGLDVDHKHNEKGEDITPPYGEMYPEVRQRIIDCGLNTLFAYKTFSDPEKGERFRIVFKTDVPIFNWDLAHSLLLGLEVIFNEYFDSACKNVNRIFHGGSSLIEEKHPLFGTPVELDKFFRILVQYFKDKYKSNYAKYLEKFARDTGLVIRNNVFAIRTVELTDEQVQELRKNEIDTYNKDFMKDYHFEISAKEHNDFFKEEKLYENVELYYIYIEQFHDFVNNSSHIFYEICMTKALQTKSNAPRKKQKSNASDDIEEIEIEQKEYEVVKEKCKLETVKVKDWKEVEERCQLYKDFTTGKREMHHDELYKLSLSLMYINGGTKRFIDTINSLPIHSKELEKNWEGYFDYNKRANYFPANCDKKFCPYADSCNHLRNMRDTVAPRNGIYLVRDMEFVELSYIEKQLEEELKGFYRKEGYLLYEQIRKRKI